MTQSRTRREFLRLAAASSISLVGLATVGRRTAAADHEKYKGFTHGQCTYFAAKRFDEAVRQRSKSDKGHDWRGSAAAWYGAAVNWKRSSDLRSPRTGAIVVWTDGGAGHVAIVTSSNANGVSVAEANWPVGDPHHEDTLAWSALAKRGRGGTYRFVGYIYPERVPPAPSRRPTRFA